MRRLSGFERSGRRGGKQAAVAVLVFALGLITAGVVGAAPWITAISVDTVPTDYVAATGLLGITGTGEPVQVDYSDGSCTVYMDGRFSLTTTLGSDTSGGNVTSGLFTGGSFAFRDSADSVLFSGNILSMNLSEIFDGSGLLAGCGVFTDTGGSLEPDWPTPDAGNLFQITFALNPVNVNSFGQNFSGTTNLSVTPVPEPASLILLALGTSSALVRRRARGGQKERR